MNPLTQKIIEKIRTEGPITFETFMDMALYYPGLGYYTRAGARIGRGGDFYTSPHLSRLFGAMIGRQIVEMWQVMGSPDRFQVVEMGAGMGYLAKDALDYLRMKEIFQRIGYALVEMNPDVRKQQEELLSEFGDKITWVREVDDLAAFKGCFVSNELLDAFPVKVIEMEDELKEIMVSEQSGNIVEIKTSCNDIIKYYFNYHGIASERFPRGYRTEVNLKIKDWLSAVNAKLEDGFVLTIDYGYPAEDYYSEERSRGTLLCYYRHQINEDPYQNIGDQDITAHLNFSSLKRWGEAMGLRTIGYTTQGTYLVSLGIDEVMQELYGDAPDAIDVARIKGLILPQGMGESHKVLIQYKGKSDVTLRGVSMRNRMAML